MSLELDNITQISIYLKGEAADLASRVNEVALSHPLSKKSALDNNNPLLKARSFSFPLSQRCMSFLFRHFKFLIPKKRKTTAAQFKTVIALLLIQPELRDFLLKDLTSFIRALKQAAQEVGYHSFSYPETTDREECVRALTSPLLEDSREFNLQMASLPQEKRNELLYAILNHTPRPPLTSCLEVNQGEPIEMTTSYGKTHITRIDDEGQIHFSFQKNQATPSIDTLTPCGVSNQRKIEGVGASCGEMMTSSHVLEQILFLLGPKKGATYYLLNSCPPHTPTKTILFTSLFSWNELSKIQEQHRAIDELHGKTLKIASEGGDKYFTLDLYHQNIPFNALNKFPTPALLQGVLDDYNDIFLLSMAGKLSPQFQPLAHKLHLARQKSDLIERQLAVRDCLQRFSKEKLPPQLAALASKKTSGIDTLIYTTLLAQSLCLAHNLNSNSIDRLNTASSAQKALAAFTALTSHPFIPHTATPEEKALYKVLYSLYLVWEEPELNCGLSTGFIGEKYPRNPLQQNPETTHYLLHYFKSHPELIAGLSSYRR